MVLEQRAYNGQGDVLTTGEITWFIYVPFIYQNIKSFALYSDIKRKLNYIEANQIFPCVLNNLPP
jgi:hypothetical protein